MASKLLRGSSCAKHVKCAYVQPALEHVNVATSSDGLLWSKPGNNSCIVSAPPEKPVSSISLVYRSGSRFEHSDNAGVSQLLRLCAGLRTKNITAFMQTRTLQQVGASVTAVGGRETLSYNITGLMNDNIQGALTPLMEMAVKPLFRRWEVAECMPKLGIEKSLLEPSFVAVDLLHRAAYQAKGLGRSLFTPDYQLKNLTVDDVMEFHASTHTTDSLSIIGLGCDHNLLMEMSSDLEPSVSSRNVVKSAYLGGEERREAGNRCAYVAIAGNGASIGSQDSVELLVAQQILGGAGGIKYGDKPCSKLATALARSGGIGETHPINANYSDGGLFGIFMVLEPKNIEKVTRELFATFKNLKISDEDLIGAKKRAKCQILMVADDFANQTDWVAMNTLATGSVRSPIDVCEAIDKVTAASVQKAVQKVTSSKMSMSAFGNIEQVPYMQFL